MALDAIHPACGWYVDQHLTNRPDRAQAASFEADGGTREEATPSAARLAYELQRTSPTWVVGPHDARGGCTLRFRASPKSVSRRSVDAALREPASATQRTCCTWWTCSPTRRLGEDLLADAIAWSSVAEKAAEGRALPGNVEVNTTVHDRLAVCRMDETGLRSNGYLIMAWVGDAADVLHRAQLRRRRSLAVDRHPFPQFLYEFLSRARTRKVRPVEDGHGS